MNRRGGITLVELLVSVSIVSLLVATLVPAILHARASARRTACLSNLRQWALAAQLYTDLHDGNLPYRGQGIQPTTRLDAVDDWINALPEFVESAPYIELVRTNQRPKAGQTSVWVCPEADYLDYASQPTFFAYGMNMALSAPFNGRPDNVEKVGPKQTMVFMADGLGPYCSVIPHREAYSAIPRHIGNTVNIAFLDGRVESLPGDEVGCGIGDPKLPHIRWFPPNTKWAGPPK